MSMTTTKESSHKKTTKLKDYRGKLKNYKKSKQRRSNSSLDRLSFNFKNTPNKSKLVKSK